MSSMYRVAPVTLSRPSLRGTDLPMMCSSVIPILLHIVIPSESVCVPSLRSRRKSVNLRPLLEN